MGEYITLGKLAEELGMDKSNLRKYIKDKTDFNFLEVRTLESGNQIELSLSLEDADSIREYRNTFEKININNGMGFFYIIQPIPEFSPNRVKLGYSNNVEGRLSTYKTIVPHAQIIKIYPCDRNWEFAVIASITAKLCKQISLEVFDCEDIGQLLDRADAFFSIMPNGA
jgi:AraC-like DNA-binding protein